MFGAALQEKRRAERAEQQRVRAEKEKERQARREVGGFTVVRHLAESLNMRMDFMRMDFSLNHILIQVFTLISFYTNI